MKKYFLIVFMLLFPVLALAQATGASGAPAADPGLSAQDFLSQVFTMIKQLGGLGWMAKIAAIITVVVSSMKVSFLNDLVWSKLGAAKAWVGIALGLVAGLLAQFSGVPFSLPALFAYMIAGGGATLLHELLDTVKSIPGIGPVWVSVINFLESNLGGPAASAPQPPAPPAAS